MSGDRITRHNSLRNLLDRFASDGLLSPVLEKQGILGPTIGRRPGDVTLPLWADGKGLAIDVAVTCPLQKASVRQFNPCEEYASTKKHGKYDKGFEGVNYLFCAMVWETLGAINEEGEEVLREVFRFAASAWAVSSAPSAGDRGHACPAAFSAASRSPSCCASMVTNSGGLIP